MRTDTAISKGSIFAGFRQRAKERRQRAERSLIGHQMIHAWVNSEQLMAEAGVLADDDSNRQSILDELCNSYQIGGVAAFWSAPNRDEQQLIEQTLETLGIDEQPAYQATNYRFNAEQRRFIKMTAFAAENAF